MLFRLNFSIQNKINVQEKTSKAFTCNDKTENKNLFWSKKKKRKIINHGM